MTTAPKTSPPPRMRQSSGCRSRGLRPDQQHAGERDGRDDQAEQEHRLAGEKSPPASRTGRRPTRMPTDSASRPSTCTMPSSALTSASGRGIAGGIDARNDLGRHRVGDHVLDHRAEDDQQRAEHVEMVGARERDPSAGGAGQHDHAGGGERRADDDVGAPLRTEDRHAVDQLAENHLDGPRQG